jgi:hypothetical protein
MHKHLESLLIPSFKLCVITKLRYAAAKAALRKGALAQPA